MAGTADDITTNIAPGEQPADIVRAIMDGLPALIGYWDRSLRNRAANRAYVEYFGWDPQQMAGLHISEVIGPDLFEQNQPYIDRVLAGEPQLFDRTIIDVTGTPRYTQASYIPDVAGHEIRGFFVLVTDITDRRLAEIALADERERIATVLDAVSDGVLSVDPAGRIVGINAAASAMCGWASDDVIGRAVTEVVDIRTAGVADDISSTCQAAMDGHHPIRNEGTSELFARDGSPTSIDYVVTPLHSVSAEITGVAVALRDVTAARQLLAETHRRAMHDRLTGLTNREYFASLDRSTDDSVLFCDLDGFKQVNDACGHHIGDVALQWVASRLRQHLRHGDDLIRFGGDEFVVVLHDCGLDGAVRVAEELIATVGSTPFRAVDRDFGLGLSVGVAGPVAGDDLDARVARADGACYQAKRAGGSRLVVADNRGASTPEVI